MRSTSFSVSETMVCINSVHFNCGDRDILSGAYLSQGSRARFERVVNVDLVFLDILFWSKCSKVSCSDVGCVIVISNKGSDAGSESWIRGPNFGSELWRGEYSLERSNL